MCCGMVVNLFAQTPKVPYTSSKFEQLGAELPSPNNTRMADGSPGHEYWQNRADYNIKVELDDEKQSIKASETITYTNNSPKDLPYLWVQLDQNLFDKQSDTYKSLTYSLEDNFGLFMFIEYMRRTNFDGGYQILSVKDKLGKPLKFTIQRTMMRIDLPTPLKAKGGIVSFSIDWSFNITDAAADPIYTRSGFEFFEKDKNYVYEIAQWFPRMAVYSDVRGWQHKQFMGRGEFALPFGNYEVAITVPADHIVAATGELQNPLAVLSPEHLKRLEQAKTAQEPVFIVSQKEAEEAEKKKANTKKTWIYKAQNVRDFAWASSRKFIWDAMQVSVEGKKVWAMSYYPKEGNPLWERTSTKVVAHTLKVYSKHSIAYPYPVAISVHGPVGGMEYPMISFNNQGRPNPDGTYDKKTEAATISVIIHEVGHNFFPMIVNSDERQWTWMDEGLNSFLQYLAEKEWDKDFPSQSGPAKKIVSYMKGDPKKLVPIMTNSEQIDLMQFGPNAYSKPATALNVLRETVMGRELFDYAFKEYSRRWAFKHPEPADFFRSMEDASAMDLDWFWRGWFFGTEPVDISLDSVFFYKTPDNKNVSENGNIKMKNINPFIYTNIKGILGADANKALNENVYLYGLHLSNVGGLISPVIIQVNYKDGTSEIIRLPAEIWRYNPENITKVIHLPKEVSSFALDPHLETADIDEANNHFPRKQMPSQFDKIKNGANAGIEEEED
ncbi:Aminopeptidase N [Thermoflexibacter ruber]|uniref:Aminopeptidase N n=2 Tax=Thermoflexibacter ruber TaxID=1003 RepID=A0A1I2G4W9_9BACT|nr:Aminopeptidase N [Thermoflexibacter ruber]